MYLKEKIKYIDFKCFPFNPRPQQVYEKAGFLENSVDKNELKYHGEWIDSINMKLTREGWENL